MVNNQPVEFSPARFIRPLAWLVAGVFGLFYGFAMKSNWQEFALYFNQSATTQADPIFQKPLGFYLFSLPVYDEISSWVMTLDLHHSLRRHSLFVAHDTPESPEVRPFAFFGSGLRRYLLRPGTTPARGCLANLSLTFSLSLDGSSNILRRYLH